MLKTTLIVLLFIVQQTHSNSTSTSDSSEELDPMLLDSLHKMLGDNFDRRFLAVEKPLELNVTPLEIHESEKRNERSENELSEFKSERRFVRLRNKKMSRVKRQANITNDDQEVNNNGTSKVDRRQSKSKSFMAGEKITRVSTRFVKGDQSNYWKCDSEDDVIDLGIDYYPRYLRTVKCKSQKCFFCKLRCRPGRPFVVKVLHRVKNVDEVASDGNTDFSTSKSTQDVKNWVFEERETNTCCECKPGDVTKDDVCNKL